MSQKLEYFPLFYPKCPLYGCNLVSISNLSNRAVNDLIGIMKSQLFGEREEEIVRDVRQLQSKSIKKLSDSFCADFWNKVREY